MDYQAGLKRKNSAIESSASLPKCKAPDRKELENLVQRIGQRRSLRFIPARGVNFSRERRTCQPRQS
jgi:hypothetical protein